MKVPAQHVGVACVTWWSKRVALPQLPAEHAVPGARSISAVRLGSRMHWGHHQAWGHRKEAL